MQNDDEQFGVPVENILAAQRWAEKQQRHHQYHTRVPTRKEVLTLPVETLTPLLIGWMVHSPIEIVPSRIQIEQVIALLLQRDDSNHLEKLLQMCSTYAHNQ